MSYQHNHVTLMGNLTRDPEIRETSAQQKVASFGIAVNRTWKDAAGEQRDEVLFIDCEAWNRLADPIGQFLSKGRPVFVEGRLRLDQWEDKDGNTRSRIKVVCTNVQFLGGAKRAAGDGEATELESDDAETATAPAAAQTARKPSAAAGREPVRRTGRGAAPAPVASAGVADEAPF